MMPYLEDLARARIADLHRSRSRSLPPAASVAGAAKAVRVRVGRSLVVLGNHLMGAERPAEAARDLRPAA